MGDYPASLTLLSPSGAHADQPGAVPPEALEAICGKFGVLDRVLNGSVPRAHLPPCGHTYARGKVRLPEIARKLGGLGRLTVPAHTGKTRPLKQGREN